MFFLKGTTAEQDNRFADKKKKLMKSMKFADNLDKKVSIQVINNHTGITLLITFKKHTLLSKQTFQRHFENRNGQYLTTLIFVSVTPN